MPSFRLLAWLAAVALFAAPTAPPALAQADRRGHSTPGLVLETGARHGACDVLTFTPDGDSLLAAGDDKVVRTWDVGAGHFTSRRSRVLRWPIYREQRGLIFALGLDARRGRLAVGGFGLRVGMLAILDRGSGKILHTLSQPPAAKVVWAVAFAPSGKQLVYGDDGGGIYRWDFASGATTARRFAGPGGKAINRVRRVAFLGRGPRFLTVAQDGRIWQRDVTDLEAKPRLLGRFELPRLYQVAVSPDGKWLAACGENPEGKEVDVKRVELFSLADRKSKMLPLPQRTGSYRFPHCLAFDGRGERLAVGARVSPQQKPGAEFFKEVGGLVYVYQVPSGKRTAAALDLGYRPDAVAFRPGRRNQLATAGGDNHEVRLWDVGGGGRLLDEVRGPGGCLWGVALSKDNRYLGFRDRRRPDPPTPNQWGGGPWRVLDLKPRPARLLGQQPRDFAPVEPLETTGGWRVRTTTGAYLWNVVGPDGRRYPLDSASGRYNAATNNMPRCYTFVPAGGGKPPRLAVGHAFGVSLYELRPGDVRLARLMVGHEGEVMAVAPSAGGKLLVTASRDKTIACWSLAGWPTHPELGARFLRAGGKLLVSQVDPGSPAWEAGLLPDDEIVALVVFDDKFVYNPGRRDLGKRYGFVTGGFREGTAAEAAAKLQGARPGRELIFVWKRDGKEMPPQLTTVRQRPLWRLFPTRADQGNEYVLWRWRDFYYDTNSPRADNYVGWHVNTGAGGADGTPRFHPLERYRRVFNRPDKVWPTVLDSLYKPDKVIFPDIEAPKVELRAVKAALRDEDLVLGVSARPLGKGPGQKLARVTLWLDDYRYPLTPQADKSGVVNVPRLVIPRRQLLRGANRVVLQAYNAQGGRGQAEVTVTYDSALPAGKPTLYGLCVGTDYYGRVKGYGFGDLKFSESDARAMERVLKQQAGSALYRNAEVKLMRRPTARQILAELRGLKTQKLKREDWLIVFLSGHGHALRTGSVYQTDSFFCVCSDTNAADPATRLTGRQLAEALADLRCHKLILLDACHSGGLARDPIRSLTAEGIPFLIFSSCAIDQSALEPSEDLKEIKEASARLRRVDHGFFTYCLLEALGGEASSAKRTRVVTAPEVAEYVGREVPALVREINRLSGEKPVAQTPVFFPDPIQPLPLLCKP